MAYYLLLGQPEASLLPLLEQVLSLVNEWVTFISLANSIEEFS